MKKILKVVLVSLPVMVFAVTVGLTTMGCGDDTTVTPPVDMATHMDMHTGGMDMTPMGDMGADM